MSSSNNADDGVGDGVHENAADASEYLVFRCPTCEFRARVRKAEVDGFDVVKVTCVNKECGAALHIMLNRTVTSPHTPSPPSKPRKTPPSPSLSRSNLCGLPPPLSPSKLKNSPTAAGSGVSGAANRTQDTPSDVIDLKDSSDEEASDESEDTETEEEEQEGKDSSADGSTEHTQDPRRQPAHTLDSSPESSPGPAKRSFSPSPPLHARGGSGPGSASPQEPYPWNRYAPWKIEPHAVANLFVPHSVNKKFNKQVTACGVCAGAVFAPASPELDDNRAHIYADILTCGSCAVVVHRACYTAQSVKGVKSGPWLCDLCRAAQLAPEPPIENVVTMVCELCRKSEMLIVHSPPASSTLSCTLESVLQDCEFQLALAWQRACAVQSDEVEHGDSATPWVHTVCALNAAYRYRFLSGTKVRLDSLCWMPNDFDAIRQHINATVHNTHGCCFCDQPAQTRGLLVPCDQKRSTGSQHCTRWFHPSCSVARRQYFVHGDVARRPRSYCHAHSPDQVFCRCKQPWGPWSPPQQPAMIQCCVCARWYHDTCLDAAEQVRLTKSTTNASIPFYCRDCEGKRLDESSPADVGEDDTALSRRVLSVVTLHSLRKCAQTARTLALELSAAAVQWLRKRYPPQYSSRGAADADQFVKHLKEFELGQALWAARRFSISQVYEGSLKTLNSASLQEKLAHTVAEVRSQLKLRKQDSELIVGPMVHEPLREERSPDGRTTSSSQRLSYLDVIALDDTPLISKYVHLVDGARQTHPFWEIAFVLGVVNKSQQIVRRLRSTYTALEIGQAFTTSTTSPPSVQRDPTNNTVMAWTGPFEALRPRWDLELLTGMGPRSPHDAMNAIIAAIKVREKCAKVLATIAEQRRQAQRVFTAKLAVAKGEGHSSEQLSWANRKQCTLSSITTVLRQLRAEVSPRELDPNGLLSMVGPLVSSKLSRADSKLLADCWTGLVGRGLQVPEYARLLGLMRSLKKFDSRLSAELLPNNSKSNPWLALDQQRGKHQHDARLRVSSGLSSELSRLARTVSALGKTEEWLAGHLIAAAGMHAGAQVPTQSVENPEQGPSSTLPALPKDSLARLGNLPVAAVAPIYTWVTAMLGYESSARRKLLSVSGSLDAWVAAGSTQNNEVPEIFLTLFAQDKQVGDGQSASVPHSDARQNLTSGTIALGTCRDGVYITADNDTPATIVARMKMDHSITLQEFIRLNQTAHPGLRSNSKFHPGVQVYLSAGALPTPNKNSSIHGWGSDIDPLQLLQHPSPVSSTSVQRIMTSLFDACPVFTCFFHNLRPRSMLGPPKPEDVDTWSLGTTRVACVDTASGGSDNEDYHPSANASRPSVHDPYAIAADITQATSWALRQFPLQGALCLVVVGFRMLQEWHESIVALHSRFFHSVETTGLTFISPFDVADIIAVPCSSQLATVCSDFDVFRGIDHVIRQCQPFCSSIERLVACFLAAHARSTAVVAAISQLRTDTFALGHSAKTAMEPLLQKLPALFDQAMSRTPGADVDHSEIMDIVEKISSVFQHHAYVCDALRIMAVLIGDPVVISKLDLQGGKLGALLRTHAILATQVCVGMYRWCRQRQALYNPSSCANLKHDSDAPFSNLELRDLHQEGSRLMFVAGGLNFKPADWPMMDTVVTKFAAVLNAVGKDVESLHQWTEKAQHFLSASERSKQSWKLHPGSICELLKAYELLPSSSVVAEHVEVFNSLKLPVSPDCVPELQRLKELLLKHRDWRQRCDKALSRTLFHDVATSAESTETFVSDLRCEISTLLFPEPSSAMFPYFERQLLERLFQRLQAATWLRDCAQLRASATADWPTFAQESNPALSESTNWELSLRNVLNHCCESFQSVVSAMKQLLSRWPVGCNSIGWTALLDEKQRLEEIIWIMQTMCLVYAPWHWDMESSRQCQLLHEAEPKYLDNGLNRSASSFVSVAFRLREKVAFHDAHGAMIPRDSCKVSHEALSFSTATLGVFKELDTAPVRACTAVWLAQRAKWVAEAHALLIPSHPSAATRPLDVSSTLQAHLDRRPSFFGDFCAASALPEGPAYMALTHVLNSSVRDEIEQLLRFATTQVGPLPCIRDKNALRTGNLVWIHCARLPPWPAFVVGTLRDISACVADGRRNTWMQSVGLAAKYVARAVKQRVERFKGHQQTADGDFLVVPLGLFHTVAGKKACSPMDVNILGVWVSSAKPRDAEFVQGVSTWTSFHLFPPTRQPRQGDQADGQLSPRQAALRCLDTLHSAVSIANASQAFATVQRRIANAAQVSGGALKTNFFVQLCTLDHLLAAALQLSTQTNDGSASGRVHTRYAQSSQQRFDGATLAVQAVFAKARADINEFVQKTKRMSAATARLVAAAAREGSGTNTSTFVSPFRKRLRAAQQKPERDKKSRHTSQNLTMAPSRTQHSDIVLTMQAKLCNALDISPDSWPLYPLEIRSRGATASNAVEAASASKLPTTLATVPDSVKKKTIGFRIKLKEKLTAELSAQRRLLMQNEPQGPWTTADPAGLADLVEKAAHRRYPFASATTSIDKSPVYKDKYRNGLRNLIANCARASKDKVVSVYAKKLLAFRSSDRTATGTLSPEALVRIMKKIAPQSIVGLPRATGLKRKSS